MIPTKGFASSSAFPFRIFSRAMASRHFAMPKLHCSKLCNSDWRGFLSPEEEIFFAERKWGFFGERGASFCSMPVKKIFCSGLHVTIPVPPFKHPPPHRDLPRCFGEEYRAIIR